MQWYSILISGPGYSEANITAAVMQQVLNVRSEWNRSLPSNSCCWQSFSSTISHLLFCFQSVILACSLGASSCMPAVVLYFSRYCTIRLKTFIFVFVYFLCIISVKNIINKPIIVQYYIADCVSWVPRLTLLDLWMCSQNGTCSYVEDLLCRRYCKHSVDIKYY